MRTKSGLRRLHPRRPRLLAQNTPPPKSLQALAVVWNRGSVEALETVRCTRPRGVNTPRVVEFDTGQCGWGAMGYHRCCCRGDL